MPENKQPVVISKAVSIGLLITTVWAVMIILYFSFGGQNFRAAFETPFLGLLTIISIILPVALIWTAVMTAGTATTVKREANLLRTEMALVSSELKTTAALLPKEQADIVSQLKLISQMIVENDRRIKQISNANEPAPSIDVVELNKTVFGDFQSADSQEQISLPLSEPALRTGSPTALSDIITSLDFPKNANDKAGFQALRNAMEDRKIRAILETAQTLMRKIADDDIYLDDIVSERTNNETWRKFADGKRGVEVSSVGAIKDKAVLALMRARMKSDSEFKDEALNFLRLFDAMLGEFVPMMQGHEITDLSETRSSRLFMILARISGAFD